MGEERAPDCGNERLVRLERRRERFLLVNRLEHGFVSLSRVLGKTEQALVGFSERGGEVLVWLARDARLGRSLQR